MGLQVRVKLSVGAEPGQVIGYYGKKRRREGEVFELEKAEHFSPRWMEAVDWKPGSTVREMPDSTVIVEATDLRSEPVETDTQAKARRRRERRAKEG